MATIGKNQFFEIKNGDGSSFHNLVLRKSAVESIVMSLGDKISGDVYYKDNTLSVTMHEYITYNGVNYMLINPPTIVKEGVVSDNSELKGMTKYSFVFYHPMCLLSNFPFTDVAVTSDETRYLSESKVFSWIGKPADFVAKMNKNLVGTEWIVELSSRFPQDKLNELSDVIPFDNATIADACKIFYDTWGVPYVVDKVASTETSYAAGKRFKLVMGLPSNEIYENAQAEQQNTPFVFQMGQGVGLKNNSRTPRNNKIITRISGYGSENNIPYGYPQVRWYGTVGQAFTYGDHAGVYNNVTIEGVHFDKIISYPIYKGILDGEYVELIKHPFTRTHLMPSVYRTTLFNKISFYDAAGEANTDYDPDITLVDYYDAVYSAQYPYPNTINLQAPSYESHEFEDEKPELGEAHIISATPLNNDLTPASSWDDSLDDEGNYKQSYFQMVLPQLSFDLYACASITEEMQINMRSGACLGCTFTVQVDWDDYKRNFYDEDGNFAPNGSQRDLTKYPKSDQGSIALVLQKDNSTFGTLMPNMYQYPKGETSTGAADGDTFVILGISLPESYIFAAEWRLDADMKSYMLENNVHYFDYPLKFDEDFLFHNENILSQIRPNTVVRFNYAGQTQALFVKQITVKYGDQPLPQYDITLTDNVEVVLNQIGQVAEDVEKLSTLIAILRQSYGKNVWNELAKKLSKTQDDTAAGYITMLKGLQVGANFAPDILGEGGCLRMRQDGKVELVTDILYARMRAYFDSVVIREYRHESGNRIKSPAQGFNASRVENIKVVDNVETIVDDASEADFFRCYWRIDDGEKKAENQFVIGDLAFCEHSDIVNGSLVTKRYWRVVIGRNAGNTTTADGEAWIDISNAKDGSGNPVMTTITYEGQGGTTQTKSVLSFESGSGYPEAHDDICMLGCTTDTTRQGAIIEYVSGVNAPTYQIYQGLGADATNPYILANKNQITIGYNTATGKADMKVYGDAYIGARDRSTFIEYKQDDGTQQHAPVLNIKAHVEFTNSDQELDTLVQAHQKTYDNAIAALIQETEDLQAQIDGAIESYFMTGAPSLTTPPVMNSGGSTYAEPWLDGTETQEERIAILNKHIGDLYYDKATGHGYRFMYDSDNSAYVWTILTDEDVTEALALAAQAQATADGKSTTFLNNTSDQDETKRYPKNYKKGDTWILQVDATINGVAYKAGDILTTSSDSTTYNAAHWSKQVRYTDDSALHSYIGQILNKTYASGDDAVAAAAQRAIQGALNGGTLVDGGLLLTSLIGMRKYNETTQQYTTWAGISGMFDAQATGNGIAAWFGGADADMEDMTEAQKTAWDALSDQDKAASADWAKTLFRFDGSGYLASNNIKWTADGKVYLANIHTSSGHEISQYFFDAFAIGIDGTTQYINPQYSFNHIDIIRRTGAGAVTLNGNSVLNRDENDARYITKAYFQSLFQAMNGSTPVDYPSTTGIDSIKALFGFWTEQYLSALGQGSDSGGGGTGDVTWTALANEATGGRTIHSSYITSALSSYATQSWVTSQGYVTTSGMNTAINALTYFNSVSLNNDGSVVFGGHGIENTILDLSHQHNFLELLDRPTTIAGYGITDAKIANGVITIGDNAITPLTSHQSVVDNNPTLAWSTKSKVATIGSTPIYVTMLAKPTYTLDDVSDGSTRKLSNYLPLTGGTLSGLLTANSGIYVPSTSYIKIGDAYLVYKNGALCVSGDSLGTTAKDFYATGGISALGQGSDSGGGGQGDVTWELLKKQATNDRYIHLSYISAALASYLTTNNYIQSSAISDMATKTWVGNQGYLTQQSLSNYYTKPQVDALARLTNVAYSSDGILAFTHQDGSTTYADFTHEHSFLELLDKPNTIAGYEISDAYINNGVVYLGNNSITPVTSVAMTVPTGFSISGSPISKTGTLAVSYASGYEGFTTSLKEKIEALFSWFELDSDGNVKTKDYYDNGTIKHRGFWSESFISALGEGNDGGGGGQGDVTWQLLKQADTRPINISHLPGALSGYATQSWVQSQGYITQSAVNVLEYLNSVTGGGDIITLTTNKGNSTIVDFTHNHEFLELIDRPTTIAGYGIVDAITTGNIGSQSVAYATSAGDASTLGGTAKGGLFTSLTSASDTKLSITIGGTTKTLSTLYASYATQLTSAVNLYIADSDATNTGAAVSFSGASNVTLKLPSTIKATLSGNATTATTAAKLSTTSKTLFGNTYWTSDGVPTSIGVEGTNAPLSYVSNIEMSGYIKIGTIYIGEDSNGDLEIYKLSNGSHVAANLYARGGVSALGQSSSGGGGGQGDVTWDLLKSSDTRQINISHLAGDANYAGVMSILTGYTTSGKNYKVKEDSNHHLYVNVPWTDTTYTLAGLMGSSAKGSTTQPIYWTGSAFANTTYTLGKSVPSDAVFTDHTYTNGTGLALSSGTFSINSTYQTYISNGNTAYGWGNHANAGYALQTSLNALEFFNSITSGSDGTITFTTNKSNSTTLDLSHQHSFQELTDKPTTIAGYGITDVYSWARQSTKPSYAFSEITGTATANQIPSIQNVNSFGTYVYSAQTSRTANTVLAAPNGSAGVASFRSLVAADIPSLDWSKIGSGKPTTLSGYGITDACTQSTANGLLYTMSLNNDGTINVSTLGGTTKYSIDFTHQHSFFELVDRPTTIDGYSITGGKFVDDITFVNTKGINLLNTANTAKKVMYMSAANVLVIGSGVSESFYSTYLRGYNVYLKFGTTGATGLILNSSGNVGIGTSSPSSKLHVDGDIYATGGVTALVATSSDIRKKNVVSYDLPLTLNQIADAPTIKFTWKDNAKLGEQVGSIAQYWQKVLPQTIRTEKDDTLSLQYGVAALVSAITTARKVVDHEKRISELEKECAELRKENELLKLKIA